MTQQALDTLFTTLCFGDYDKDFQQYQILVNSLVKKYDYQSVIDKIEKILNTQRLRSDFIYNKYDFFKMSMGNDFQEKKTYEEYINEEQELIKDFENIKEGTQTRPNIELDEKFSLYKKYTLNYLSQISLERNKPITALCEVKGLNPKWLIYR